MPTLKRVQRSVIALLALLGAVCALVPAHGESIHRYGFGGKRTVLVRGDANVKVEEKEHDISDQSFKSQPTSEHIKLTADIAIGDSAYIHYHYDTPPAPVTDALSAGVWVKATKPGVQLRARVVLPKEPDPARPELPLTMLIIGDSYDKPRQWQKLTLTEVPALLGKHLPVLKAKIGRAVNSDGAYIDRLVLNLYTGPGTAEIWIDDLDIGPIKPAPEKAPGTVGKQPRPADPSSGPRGRMSEFRPGQLFVDNKPFFFRAVRHTGTPLHVLRQAGFDSLWVPGDVSQDVLDEANREGWLIIPSAPLAPPPSSNDKESVQAASTALTAYYRKFSGTDVLFWELGSGRVAEQDGAVDRTKNFIRGFDPKRPFGADVWDGFQSYSTILDVIGAHRWPLFTSLELDRYRDWLGQRSALTSSHAVFWTWVQNHLPDWYIASVLGQKNPDAFNEPIGPHPEQVRLLAYISLGCNCRGLGFWSDRFLADSHHGRGRLQGMAILNSELAMLAPILAETRKNPEWLPTDHPNVKAVVIRTTNGAILLPIWFGTGSQFVPEQGALKTLKIVVPLVEDGSEPWRLTPAGVESLGHATRKVTGGTELIITEFDLVTPVVFTSDRERVVWWQDYTRKYGKLAARWALDLASEEYEKTFAVHNKLLEMGLMVRDADRLFQQSVKFHEDARRNFAAELYDKAFADAHRALRPLRVIMRDHWNQATATLDIPTASPYAVSFYSLPKHWELFRELQGCKPAQSLLPGGAFEVPGAIPPEGLSVDQLPNWTARYGTLDRVDVAAGIVPSAKLADPVLERPKPRELRMFAPSRPIALPDAGGGPAPELGNGVLKLEVRPRAVKGRDGKLFVPPASPLERTYLAVESPPVRLPAGTLVRVSGWMKIEGQISQTADGALLFDDACGEPLGVRLLTTGGRWKRFHLYRRVPASGQISVTVALTGVGVAYFDDLRVEPMIQAEREAGVGPRKLTMPPVLPTGGTR